MAQTGDTPPFKVDTEGNDSLTTPTKYPVRIEWIAKEQDYYKAPAAFVYSAASNDIQLPSNIATFSELSELVIQDADLNTPFNTFMFFAYNKNGNLVALCSEARLRSWIADLAGYARGGQLGRLWIANEEDIFGYKVSQGWYMTEIEEVVRKRKLRENLRLPAYLRYDLSSSPE